MGTVWFCLVAIMIAMYVLLDGFDLGAGAIHLLIAKTDQERRQVLASIGPVWDGNEVWLLAAGGTLYFAFPALYASGFSGFYLPLMMVLWLLILRGTSIEFRNQLRRHHPGLLLSLIVLLVDAGVVWIKFVEFQFGAWFDAVFLHEPRLLLSARHPHQRRYCTSLKVTLQATAY
jgi:cytochrome d oxidase subunit CydB